MLGATVGCSSASTPSARTTRDTTSSTTSAVSVSAPCAWPTKADKATLNVAYPDTGATYWTTGYRLARGERLAVHGRFPAARYMSFITYGPNGGAIAMLTDRDIAPDAGDVNPFRGRGGAAGATGGGYGIEVRGDTQPAENTPNTLYAVSATGATTTVAPTTTTVPGAPSAPLPLGSGIAGAQGVVAGTLIYRVYLPTSPRDPTGGGSLPEVHVIGTDGRDTAVRTCPHPGRNPAAAALVDANGPATNAAAPPQPVFIRPKQDAAHLYPNPDNVYLASILHYVPGRIVIVRGMAPTFPNTARGARVIGNEQVRYWSLCTDEYRKPYPVSFCVADQDVALDARRMYTIVVSTRAERPRNADAAHGITWLEWGSTSVNNLLLMRHMLGAPTFAQSAFKVAPGSLASSTMGAYAPKGVYCTTSQFARGGPSACP